MLFIDRLYDALQKVISVFMTALEIIKPLQQKSINGVNLCKMAKELHKLS